ncbi:sensor histidine kinase [Rhodoblastus acidophilus]|uniref:histidine kinase n=1 Tax=Candidatus Rhodoblastus alkanivorans TaxID=2954117 RepID=A0ABS9Z2G1_9HYPH|nr:ATP-binding protein [Candidatus Rhodoblastus alkanivorans]MCI4678029.1 sensor histidine kinase [Candidatus Rhodoblastus alkanivorans]MCI4681630.1 sensor histidine kinase [Candidatus Rhodoblastus alkanivorans]MDI4642678.1 sensor histidine kinase [Rhodoblastus acidophilus]
MTRAAPSLISIVVRRIVLFAALTMVAQLTAVILEYWRDTLNLGHLAIEMETTSLTPGLTFVDGLPAYTLPENMRARYGTRGSGYFMRVLDPSGAILYSNCAAECDVYFPTRETRRLDFWMMEQRPGKPLYISGGRSISDNPNTFTIDVAFVGDRDGVIYRVLANEIKDHMALPMTLLLIVVLGATSLSIAQALRPVRESADLAAKLDPLAPTARLPLAGMPREIADYAKAVNGALERVFSLMQSQRVMTSAISHEVRTPLAIARLELEKIADPRARKVEEDLEALNHLVEQLTTLARLEGAGVAAPEKIEPDELAQQVVAAMAPLVYESGRTIAFEEQSASPFRGHRALIENALRNLIDNAIRHTGQGAAIRVTAGPGPCLSVYDDGGAAVTSSAWRRAANGLDRPGLGLKIVSRIAELHAGRFDIAISPPTGAVARLCMPPSDGDRLIAQLPLSPSS